MRNFYYFSKNKLKFVEIENFGRKFVFITLCSAILISGLIFGGFYFYTEFVNPNSETAQLLSENRLLAKKLEGLLANYQNVEMKLDSLSDLNNDLRLVNNLLPVTDEEREVGIGGALSLDIDVRNSSELASLVNRLDSAIAKVTTKINFEVNNYNEINEKLEYNKKLYDALPAIKPAEGRFGDRYGMRMHPVLKIRRMHHGIDLLVNTGTDVHASGAGKVVSVRRTSGLGLMIEIDHGYGYTTRYGHLKEALTKVGTQVKRGDLIALSGSSGKLSTGAHLHYEVRHNGISLNPRNFIFDDVKLFEIAKNE